MVMGSKSREHYGLKEWTIWPGFLCWMTMFVLRFIAFAIFSIHENFAWEDVDLDLHYGWLSDRDDDELALLA